MKNLMKNIFLITLSIFLFQSCIDSGKILPDSLVTKPLGPNDPGSGNGNGNNNGICKTGDSYPTSNLIVANVDGVDSIFELNTTGIVKYLDLPEHTYLNSAVKIGEKVYYALESLKFNALGVSEVYELDLTTRVSNKISQFHQELSLGVSSVTKAGNVLYASARSNSNGFELHKYSNNQWQLVKDIESGIVGSFPAMFIELNDKSHFLAYEAASGMELWSTNADGSLHANLYAGKASSHVMPWFVKNNQIIATSKNANSTTYDLYGINEQGVASKLLEPGAAAGAGANPLNAFSYKQGVAASCHHDATGRELCVNSNLSGQWTILDINSGSKPSNPKFFTLCNDELYFQAEGAQGIELYKTNGSTFSLVHDLKTGSASSYPENLMVIGTKLYFSAYGANGPGLYSFNGTTINKVTVQQKELKYARSLLHPSR